MNPAVLTATAHALVAPGKGILAADESSGTIKKRFDTIQLASTEENRRAYRELLFTTDGAEQFISGVILYDETMRQQARDGTPLPQVLAQRGVIPGIKVDKGTKNLAFYPGEKITEGLDGLAERLADYHALGARFTKWRAVIDISPTVPTLGAIRMNAQALARYAALCQEQDLVPIVEPEVLMDGDHDIDRCAEVTELVLRTLFDELYLARVSLEGLLLKPNMIIPGKKALRQAGADEVAEATLRILHRAVPSAVPGIVFLSGGQTPAQATENLNALNRRGPHPWQLSFSYGRALQEPVLQAWRGSEANVFTAQRVYYHRAACNGSARFGTYTAAQEMAELHHA